MAPVQGAVVTFSNFRSCFISVPEKWIKPRLAFQDISVFKVEYSGNRRAYFSCKAQSSNSCSENEIELNGKYAVALDLKEKELVLIQQVENAIPQVEKVYLEPLNSDDWEIMQLNAQTIERELLSQIRIIWKGQVFPVWAHQSSFFVKVAQVEPDVEPALLVEWTEIYVTPKERNVDDMSHSSGPKKKDLGNQYKHLRKCKKTQKSSDSSFSSPPSDEPDSCKLDSISLPNMRHSPADRPVFSLFRYVMRTVFQNSVNSSSDLNSESSPYGFVPLNLSFRLRVISYSKNTLENLPLALQATVVFITDKTFRTFSDMYPIPDCFVAKLSKLLSPSELKEKQQALQSRDTKDKSKKGRSDKHSGPVEKYACLDTIYVTVVILKSLKEEFNVPTALFLNSNFIAVPLEIKRRLGLEIASRVLCESVDCKPFFFNSIILRPLEALHMNFEDGNVVPAAFRKWVEDANLEDSSIVLSDGTLVKLDVAQGRSCDFIVFLAHGEDGDSPMTSPSSLSSTSLSSTDSEKISSTIPTTLNYGYLNHTVLQKLQIKVGGFSPQLSKCVWCHFSGSNKIETLYHRLPALSLEALGGVQDIAEQAISDFELWFHLSPLAFESNGYSFNNGSMLIYGPKGVGKTTLMKALCKKLMNYPYYIFITTVECLPLRGKRTETIAKKWEAVLAEAAYRQPSLILFENLDKLASAPATPEQEASPDALYFATVAQTFITLTEKIADSKSCIVVVATSVSTRTLYPTLMTARGRHVFQRVLEIKPPDARRRAEILQSLVLSKLHISADSLETADWQALAAKTEGFVAQDLDNLVDRATHAAFVRTNFTTQSYEGNEQVSVIHEDFEMALTKYTPSSLRGLQLHRGNNKTWKDVGGLHNVKQVIEQILTWPVKYKELFKNFALRPQTNILLYGPPGTGKTLIAGVIASECGLNFISIKGPELLSKYIGASEHAVRDLFSRASSAKPCVLFFDEFDALAPRRGHDSTGVTDRVVNQLLTQIDGVESLEGVYILAATSRPELIDPALLRPGRFDRCLYCPLPDVDERFEILVALASKLSLSDDVNFKTIAQMTEHFSGADLQALLYSAQIEALHESQSNRSRRGSFVGAAAENLCSDDTFLYMPTVEQGIIEPPLDKANEVMQEINTIFENATLKRGEPKNMRDRRRSTISMSIEQGHLLKVLSDMKPSVSAEERLHYEYISRKFQGHGAIDLSPRIATSGKRVTLA